MALGDNLGSGDLAPDNVPQWLVDSVRRSKGRDMSAFSALGEFFKERNVVKSDRFDKAQFSQMADKAAELDDLRKSKHVDKPSFADLIEDEYLGLYKAAPKRRHEKEMRPTHKINHAALTRAMETREWDELLTYTQLDEWASAMAAVDFGLKLSEIFDEIDELAELQEEIDKRDEELQKALSAIEQGGEGLSGKELEAALDALEKASGAYGEAAGAVNDGIKAHSNQIRQAGRQAAREAKEQTENTEALLDSFGTEPGALTRMDATARMELAGRIRRNRNLKELAEKVGRFVRLALSEQATKITHGIDEIHDIEMGNDVHKALPSELLYLGDDDLDILFLKKYADKELLQYQLRGVEKVSRGAMVVMIDSSGSMSGVRDTWARAVAIALLHIAYRQGRHFYGIIFSSYNDPLLEFRFPKGVATPSDVLDFAEAGYHGGTDFEKPVTRGVKVLTDEFNDEGKQKGDLVMITDGECQVSEDWLATYHNNKEHLGFRMYSCLIGTQSATLTQMSDDIYHITDFYQGGDVKDMFGYV